MTTTKLTETGTLVYGDTITLEATVAVKTPGLGQPTGTVAFYDNGVLVSSAQGVSVNSSGVATLNLQLSNVGSNSFTASYSGDGNFAGSPSGTLTKTVAQAAVTVTLTSSTNPSVYGQSVTFTATVASSTTGTPTGSVTFWDGSTELGTVSLDTNGAAEFTTFCAAANRKAYYQSDV